MPKIRQKINRKKDCFLEYKIIDFNIILRDSPYMFNNKKESINMTQQTKKEDFYMRDHIKAFDNAKVKGLHDPEAYMYMYSKDNNDFFKNINFRNYIKFEQ